MKKFVLILTAVLLLMLCACGQAPAPDTDGDSPSEQQPVLLEISGFIESWENDLLNLIDGQGVIHAFAAGAAAVSGDFTPEPGCPATVTVAEDAPEEALAVCVLAPPRDQVLAQRLLSAMTLEEKVGQMFLARCPEEDGAGTAARCHLGGYVLFARDFAGLSPDGVRERIDSYQQAAALPLFIAVDEEGGDVVRVSLYEALRSQPFDSPQSIYRDGGLEALAADAREKGALLRSLGLNVDLAPVADVSTSPDDFIYSRSLGEDAATTAQAVAAIVRGLHEGGVAATLKHFPGYGNNEDTHTGIVWDGRPAEVFYGQDLLPFRSGIEAGAEFVLVSHNLVAAFDSELPASLSPAVHELLRAELGFTGVIITDDLIMGGVAQLYDAEETAVLAVLAGNDMLLSSDPDLQTQAVLEALYDGRIAEQAVDRAVERILRAKMRAGLIDLPPLEEWLGTDEEGPADAVPETEDAA